MRRPSTSVFLSLAVVAFLAGGSLAADVTFEDRVRAQAAIEEIYHRHRIGESRPFEQAVPRAHLEEKVRTYLKQSLALDTYWHETITTDALQREMRRIAAGSRLPDRLLKIYDALGQDSTLIHECVARPALVRRRLDNLFAHDTRIHGDRPETAGESVERISFDEWWASVADEFDPDDVGPPDGPFPPAPWPTAAAEDDAPNPLTCEGTWDSGTLDDAPDPYDEHTAVWTGSEMIVWGGEAFVSWGTIYDPALDTWRRTSTIDAPEPRFWHTANWTGAEMIVWGGVTFGPSDRLNTGGRYDPATDTWTPTTTDGAPAARAEHEAVWTGSEMIVWGGGVDGGYSNDGARYDPSSDSWTTVSTTGAPVGRYEHTAVWAGSEMIVWGGNVSGGSSNDGGRYDPSSNSWATVATTGAPVERSEHVAVWTGSEMIVWGGQTGPPVVTLGTGGRYDPSTDEWIDTSLTDAPAPRNDHSAVWADGEMIVWGGGYVGSTGGRYDPSRDEWTATNASGAPSERGMHTAVWTGSEMIVFGGRSGATALNDGGRYDPEFDDWTPTSLGTGPEGRQEHSAVWTGSEMIVWGGRPIHAGSVLDTGGRYDPLLDLWTPTATTGVPAARRAHTAVWADGEMVVWGGYFPSYHDTGGRYDPALDTWSATSADGAPSGRHQHTAVWADGRMLVCGGVESGFNPAQTGGEYLPSTDTWVSMPVGGARANHTAVWTGDEMIIFGGDNADDFDKLIYAGPYAYDPVQRQWRELPTDGQPHARSRHTAVWTGDSMIVWGGTNSQTGGVFDGNTETWSATTLIGAPSGRQDHTAVWTGDEMIVWGGGSTTEITNEGARYNPVADAWTEMPTLSAPRARLFHTAVWGAGLMMVWDGVIVSNGGRYAAPVGDTDGDGRVDACDNCPAIANLSQIDDDEDGAGNACDCFPGDPTRIDPGEVGSLTVEKAGADTARLAWTTLPAADSYAVTRGPSSASAPGEYGPCLETGISTTTYDDDTPTPADEGFHYLVHAESAICGSGSLGIGVGGERVNSDPAACP